MNKTLQHFIAISLCFCMICSLCGVGFAAVEDGPDAADPERPTVGSSDGLAGEGPDDVSLSTPPPAPEPDPPAPDPVPDAPTPEPDPEPPTPDPDPEAPTPDPDPVEPSPAPDDADPDPDASPSADPDPPASEAPTTAPITI